MEIKINKSAKRVLSVVLALAMLVGSLFTANLAPVTIVADAETVTMVEKTRVEYWDGSTKTQPTTKASDGTTIIINNAAELAWITSNSTTSSYKVADDIKAFVMQPSSTATYEELAALSGYENVKAFFTAEGKSFKTWAHNYGSTQFKGKFDGNGVAVYGLYCYGIWNNAGGIESNGASFSQCAGLFPTVGETAVIKNVSINTSYLIVGGNAGALIGRVVGTGDGVVKVNNVEISNCYTASSFTTTTTVDGVTQHSVSYNASGVLLGQIPWSSYKVGVTIENAYVHDSYSEYVDGHKEGLIGNVHSGYNGTGTDYPNYGLKNSLILDVIPYSQNGSQHGTYYNWFENVYTNIDYTSGDNRPQWVINGGSINYYTSLILYVSDEANLKDTVGKTIMGNFNWATDETAGDDGLWYARENDYPTPIMPAGWKDTVKGYSMWSGSGIDTSTIEYDSGDGTKENPYIISTADQLWKMVAESSNSYASSVTHSVEGYDPNSTELKTFTWTHYLPKYFKVKDGVERFYLSAICTKENLDSIKDIASTATKWNGTNFYGNFDGNGVSIYGMVTTTGFVKMLGGVGGGVRNTHFKACYASNSSAAAIVATSTNNFGVSICTEPNLASHDEWPNCECKHTPTVLSNVSVTESYIHSDIAKTSNASAGGLMSIGTTPARLNITNCLFDGGSCELTDGLATTNGANTASPKAGIISTAQSGNNIAVSNCVSIGEYAMPMVSGLDYSRYYNQTSAVRFLRNYSEVNTAITGDSKYAEYFAPNFTDIDSTKTAFAMTDMPLLGWGNNWTLAEVDGRTIPMPVANSNNEGVFATYNEIIGYSTAGGYVNVEPYSHTTNPYTYMLKGSGTSEDPYLIENAKQLARAIATGGMDLGAPICYKLVNDIDISGYKWIDTVSFYDGREFGYKYEYTPFGGTLDGNGHTVTGLFASDSASAGLIPVLEGGTVKNLHLRDVTAVSGDYAGAIVGWMYGGSVTGCSVENAVVNSPNVGDGLYIVYNDDIWTPDEYGTITNSYYIGKDIEGNDITVYITDHNADDGVIMVDADAIKNEIVNGTTDEWYIGGKEGSLPRLVAQAEKMDCADVDGDGIGSEYTTNDLTSLRNNLLKKSAYKYIFGDVSRNGTTNIADLAALQRTMADDYGSVITDSFFANVKAGNIKVYYGENDNYDAARKVELYLEELTGTDITKVVSSSKGTVTGANSDSSKVYLHAGDSAGTPDGELEIIVGNIDNYSAYATNTVATADNTYAVTYDAEKKVVWLQGANFTAVEQAAINFANGCSVQGDVVYTCASTTLEDYKKPVTVALDSNHDGTAETTVTYYYVWSDEFDDDEGTSTYDRNKWNINSYKNGKEGAKQYVGLVQGNAEDLNKLWVVENGRLTIKRGYRGTLTGYENISSLVTGETNDFGQEITDTDMYIDPGLIKTEESMLYKRGYAEMKAKLPSDGHAFPAWWFLTGSSHNNNSYYDRTLYSKIYELNDNYDKTSNGMDGSNLDTYKYKIPNAHLEFDVVEFMQGTTSTKYMDYIQLTIHKIYDENSRDGVLSIIDWDNYKRLKTFVWQDDISDNSSKDNTATGVTNTDGTAEYYFTGTSSEDSFIHRYNPSTTYAPYFQYNRYYNIFGNTGWEDKVNASFSFRSLRDGMTPSTDWTGWSEEYDGSAEFTNAQQEAVYSFVWESTDSTYDLFVYIQLDTDEDGDFKDENRIMIFHVDETTGHEYADETFGSGNGSDAHIWNQYANMLLDNAFYTSNSNDGNTFTDLAISGNETANFEIDYVRVYQQEDRRDVVTPETESFNNGNHFGY